MSKKICGKVGFCQNKYLNGLEHLSGGHYVYIRQINFNGTCDVNIVTSLEDKDKKFTNKKIKNLKKGNTYCIPKRDADFSRWSGINKTPIKNVDVSKIVDIDKIKIKDRHKFFIGKFLK